MFRSQINPLGTTLFLAKVILKTVIICINRVLWQSLAT